MQPYFPLHQMTVPVVPSAARAHTPITAMDATARNAQATRASAQKKALREAALVRNVAHNMRFAQANMALLAAQQNELARQGAQITHPLLSPALPGNTYGQPPGFLERGLNNPWTVFGANLMSAGDITGQGLGPIGDAMLSTRAHMQRQALQDEYRQLQHYGMGMKVRAANQQYAARQAEQQRLEAFIQSLPPEQQAAARANPEAFSKQAAQAAYREEPMSAARRIFKEMGGQRGTGKNFPDWYSEDYKSGGTTVNVGGVSEPVRKETMALGGMEDALDRYEALLGEYGTETLPTEGKTRLKTAYTNLLMQAKEAANLGALSGADLELIEGMVSDPTSVAAGVRPTSVYRAQADELRRMLEGRRSRFMQTLPEGQRATVRGATGAYPEGRTGRNRTSRVSGREWQDAGDGFQVQYK